MAINKISNYSLYQHAISDSTGEAGVYLHEDNIGGHSIAVESEREPDFKVEKLCLDDFDTEVTNVRFLHIDTEGHDFKILTKAYKFIARQQKKPIVELEFFPRLLVANNSSIDELLSFVEHFDYQIYMNAANALSPLNEAIVADIFDLWKLGTSWIDLYLLPTHITQCAT